MNSCCDSLLEHYPGELLDTGYATGSRHGDRRRARSTNRRQEGTGLWDGLPQADGSWKVQQLREAVSPFDFLFRRCADTHHLTCRY